MNLLNKVYEFIKQIFNKKNNIKMIETPKAKIQIDEQINYRDSIKIDNTKKVKKKRIETLICDGDGLGIQNKISY